MDDKRILDRKSCRLRGQLLASDTSVPVHCLIEDLSARGARLKLDAPVAIPDELILVMPWKGGERIWVRKRWKRDNAIGVEFLPADCIDSYKLVKLVEDNVELRETLKKASERLAALGQKAIPVDLGRRQSAYNYQN